ncbi:MAG TPA: heme-binding protein [Alphaproteobacteria bacterium]|nr:heme-binding protein [Alphaproteobacteria bacterium]HAJ47234.1 heme-binding protein [Alphaproteobacteria bacterium]
MFRLILGVLALAVAALPAGAIEEPKYQVVRKVGAIEVRSYPAILVAETTVTGDFADAGDDAFRPLFGYISGKNTKAQEIAMTAPVIQEGQKIAMTAPVIQEGKGGTYVVQFVMPATFTLETLPKPTDPKVSVREVPGRTVAVIRYSGRWTQSNYDENLALLRAEMSKAGLTATGDPIWARYDDPFTLWFNRRNEIMIPIAGV